MLTTDKQQYHYIYKVTRTFDKKYYIGMHSTDDISDGYLGSGLYLLNSIEKYGKDKHTKKILEFLPTRKALQEREEEIINEELLKDPLCMNIITGGKGFSSEQAKKMWRDPEYKAKKSKASSKTLKKTWQDPIYRAKMSEIVSKRWQDPMYRAKMSKASSETLKKTWQNHANRAKISKAVSERWAGTIWIKHPELKNKRIKKDEPIPEGWKKGRRMPFLGEAHPLNQAGLSPEA